MLISVVPPLTPWMDYWPPISAQSQDNNFSITVTSSTRIGWHYYTSYLQALYIQKAYVSSAVYWCFLIQALSEGCQVNFVKCDNCQKLADIFQFQTKGKRQIRWTTFIHNTYTFRFCSTTEIEVNCLKTSEKNVVVQNSSQGPDKGIHGHAAAPFIFQRNYRPVHVSYINQTNSSDILVYP